MIELREQVANLIRETRKLKGLSQKQLGDRLGINHTAVAKYESGERNLSLDVLQEIAVALEVHISDLIPKP